MKKLSELYYTPTHLWRGTKAIETLQKEASVSRKQAISFLTHQALWQVHLPPPKHIRHIHFDVTEPNKLHKADLMFLPHDSVYGTTYKYVLCVIDVDSRFKAARPLKSKKASEVAEMLADIYRKGPLIYPKEFHCDGGTEFRSDTTKLLEKHDVKIKRVTTKYHHRFTAFVERMNRTLAERLFKIQDAQELNNPKKDSKTWVKHLQPIIESLNNAETSMIGMKPIDAIKLAKVELVKSMPIDDKPLPIGGLYRYLYAPGELEGGQQRRATDMIWSWDTFRLDRKVKDHGQPWLYYLANAPQRAFVREELMLIPEETELPPDHVKAW